VVVHPNGRLTVRQKIIPLGINVQKFGASDIADGDRFDIERVQSGGDALPTTTVKDEFAPAQFFDLSDSQKLSRDSFEQLPSGVTIGASDRVEAGPSVTRIVEYEQIIIDSSRVRLLLNLVMRVLRFRTLLRGGCMAQSDAARKVRAAGSALSPGRVSVQAEGYTVVSTLDLRPVDGFVVGLSQTEAHQRMSLLLNSGPSLEASLQVVPNYEVAADG
jgi:hypothetical protein